MILSLEISLPCSEDWIGDDWYDIIGVLYFIVILFREKWFDSGFSVGFQGSKDGKRVSPTFSMLLKLRKQWSAPMHLEPIICKWISIILVLVWKFFLFGLKICKTIIEQQAKCLICMIGRPVFPMFPALSLLFNVIYYSR